MVKKRAPNHTARKRPNGNLDMGTVIPTSVFSISTIILLPSLAIRLTFPYFFPFYDFNSILIMHFMLT